MSRSGYTDDFDNDGKGWLWRRAVANAMAGKRGQAMLRELVAALDALPEKVLDSEELVSVEGTYCAMGALGRARGMDMANIDPDNRGSLAKAFGIAPAMAAEVMFMNDECVEGDLISYDFEVCGPMRVFEKHMQLRWKLDSVIGRQRWAKMRAWAVANVKG